MRWVCFWMVFKPGSTWRRRQELTACPDPHGRAPKDVGGDEKSDYGYAGKRGVFEAEVPAEGKGALLDLRRFSRAAERPQRLRSVVQRAGKRRPCLHLLEEPDRVVKVRERRRPVRRRLECECTTTGPQHPRLAIAVVHATRAAQGLVPAGHAGGQISELRVA